jgi:hypothetical protein
VLASAFVSIPREAYLRTTEGQPSLNKGVEMRWCFLHLPILFPSLSLNTMNQCTVSSVMTAILSALKKRHDIPKTVQALQDVSLYPPQRTTCMNIRFASLIQSLATPASPLPQAH